ncbi:carboxymuconolactone decarboxylase family protein [Sinosporangium siamense]|uniref:Alkyl hydroperoxide reductase AhpD n=1 Tax=Sinosporangium siamense TaxID=1367973 RepID=A0A919RHP6_9ACTN|nr:carboxymuconolactone decarboxylase family protein [Sinosporangium siamense]GII92156.1 alkyl hydroperoxide reductase AhpD [Sinosporangium siamense]
MKTRLNAAAHAKDAYAAFVSLDRFVRQSGLPDSTYELVKLRVSQINGCGYCVDLHSHEMRNAGETHQRLFSVGAWREAPWFTDAERAALALAEEGTRLADRGETTPDEVWQEAAKHYDRATLSALVIAIATINGLNRIGVTTRMTPGSHRTR